MSSQLDHWRTLLDQADTCPPPLSRQRPVGIYGAGKAGKALCHVLLAHGFSVACLIDRQAQPDQTWRGIKVLPPDSPGLSLEQRRTLDVVVALFNHTVDVKPVMDFLRSLGYGHVMSFLDAHAQFPEELGDWFWLTKRASARSHLEAILHCQGLWEDEQSRELYRTLLEFRASGDYAFLPPPEVSHHYFPPSVPLWETRPVRYVDCGAFTGETIREVVARCAPVEAVAAFEPDLTNFDRLAQGVRECREAYPAQCLLWPCALWSHTSLLSFSGDGKESSSVTTTGTSQVTGVALDDVIPSFRPTVIKYDVEGAEHEALLGSRRLIDEFRPALAVSAYHHPTHLWELALLLHDWRYNYRFFLRMHSHNGFDVVLYALPE